MGSLLIGAYVLDKVEGDAAWAAPLFGAGMAIIGFAFALGSLHFARRAALLSMNHDRMSLVRSSPLRTRVDQWPVAEIDRVTVAVKEGLQINNQTVHHIEVRLRSGRVDSVLVARDLTELQWIVTHVRQRLDRAGNPARA